ncbi:uncharacterized protein BO88DRAFT_1152 [Aspergillus vadensis CBS 113365]|uniref:Uncharacterized protein n=1 Tax=Aspergillus vadensis (strain CBS 113365 / IMI 142717 / IBT 24658) TaxID=1448311 RepID=A0A319BLB8_ASPVC|nr:hypothetical protein BO88DRAFT_1152 [Aspergillus vadensis CBS 113365]PYH74056.1 hypothetical protein BO88DRAFT_1152 [Aspergillus vadensis CBS 113365]
MTGSARSPPSTPIGTSAIGGAIARSFLFPRAFPPSLRFTTLLCSLICLHLLPDRVPSLVNCESQSPVLVLCVPFSPFSPPRASSRQALPRPHPAFTTSNLSLLPAISFPFTGTRSTPSLLRSEDLEFSNLHYFHN